MFVHRVQSTHGRLIPKPIKRVDNVDEIVDENIPIQDQIENLRTKIALKERYNRVLSEQFEQSKQGTSNVIQDLYYETRDLRIQLMEALTSEQAAVQNALRTHRHFQLAMTDRRPTKALPWLEDKLFDLKKKLNSLLDRLNGKRKKLEDAEQLVVVIEKWPRAGSLPWEMEAARGFANLENIIETFKIKRETSLILRSKYFEIRMVLREERGKYAPMLRLLENNLRTLRNESDSLITMKNEAYLFHDDAEKDVALTDQEASENRKQRRKQMSKIKKSVEKVLAENEIAHNITIQSTTDSISKKLYKHDESGGSVSVQNILDLLRLKKEEVSIYQNEARRLVETMRVPDLTYIPDRLKTVKTLGNKLKSELASKSKLKELMLRQKNQLILLQCYFRYTGHHHETEYKKRQKEYQTALETIDQDLLDAQLRLQKIGDISISLRLSMIALFERLEPEKGTKVHRKTFVEPDLKSQMRVINEKIRRLTKTVQDFEHLFEGLTPERNYAQFVKQPIIPERLVRVGSPVVSDESEEEDMPDSKVPNSYDIKMKSQKIIQQTILKRGLS